MGANPAFFVGFVFLFFLFALSKLMLRWELSQTRAKQDPLWLLLMSVNWLVFSKASQWTETLLAVCWPVSMSVAP